MNIIIKRIGIILFLLIQYQNIFCQLNYLGLSNMKLSISTNPNLKIINDTIFVATQNGLYKKSVNSNDTIWYLAGFQGMKINDFSLIAYDTIVCVVDSNEGNSVFTTFDNGTSIINTTNGFGGTGFNYQSGTRIDINKNNHQEIIAMSGSCVAKSVDFCGNWAPSYLTWGYTLYQSTILKYHPLNNEIIYSGGELNLFDSYIAYSLDSGTNWALTAIESNNAVNCIAFHPTNENIIFIGKEGKIARSNDKGINWSDIYFTPNYEYIYSIIYDEGNNNILYSAGAINGQNDTIRIFKSIDGGNNWFTWYVEAFSNSDKQVISLVMRNNSLFLLTRDHFGNSTGVYKLNILSLSNKDMLVNEKLCFFPNPFNDETYLNLSIELNDATLTIFDISGKKIKSINHISGKKITLTQGDLEAGSYMVNLKDKNNNYTTKLVVN